MWGGTPPSLSDQEAEIMNKATEEPEVCKATPTSGRVAESLVLNHNTHSQAFSKRLLVGESAEKPLEIGRVFLFWPQWAVPSHGLPPIPPSVAPSPLLGRFNGAEGGGPEQWPGQGPARVSGFLVSHLRP